MGLYTEKIAQNQMKIDKLNELIKKHTEKRKQLEYENALMSYNTLCAGYRCEGQELLDIIKHEHDQIGSSDESATDTTKTKTKKYAETESEDVSDSDFADQLSFT